MKNRSAKNKGQRAVIELKAALLDSDLVHRNSYGGVDGDLYQGLDAEDIRVVPGGVPGEDLWLSPRARGLFPFTFEVKNQEKLQIWPCIKQSEGHAEGTPYTPLLVFKRNREELHVCLKLSDFLALL